MSMQRTLIVQQGDIGNPLTLRRALCDRALRHGITLAKTPARHCSRDQPPPADVQRLPKSLAGVGLVKLTAAGRVLRVTSAPRGEPDGVLLTDGTVIKLTPAAAAQFTSLLQPGTTIAAQGYGTRNRYGESLQATAFGTPGNLTVLYDNLPK